MDKARVESFSDGVFAFAITLLVFGVQVPTLTNPGDCELRIALLHSAGGLVPYLTSFATIGIIWLNHHELFQGVQKVDHFALTLNLALLLVVAFIPYPTAILGKYGPLPSAACLYGLILTLLGIIYSLLALHLVRNCLDPIPDAGSYWRSSMWRNAAGPLVYLLATLLALRWPKVSVSCYFLTAAFYFLPSRSLFDGPPTSETRGHHL
jgi:uncharacterized membrane protein